jgi:hypothetical protein
MIDTDKTPKERKILIFFFFFAFVFFLLFVYNKRTYIRTNRELFSLSIFNEKKKTSVELSENFLLFYKQVVDDTTML